MTKEQVNLDIDQDGMDWVDHQPLRMFRNDSDISPDIIFMWPILNFTTAKI